MPKQLIPIPKIFDKLTFHTNSAIRDAVEHLEEGAFPSELLIQAHGELFMYEDGHRVFKWKGKDSILFYPLKMSIDEYGDPQLDFSYEILYERIE